MTAEWAGEGVSPSIDSPYWRAYRDDPEDVAALSQGHVVRVPTRLASGEEGRVMRSEGIVTTVSVPILVAGSLWGYLGLDDCKEERPWETVETEALRAAAGILGAAVERSRSRAELDASERILAAVARGAHQVVGAPSWREAIDSLLMLLGEGAGASRAYLFECRVTSEDVRSTLMREWVAEGISSSLVDEFWTDAPEPEADTARFLAGEPVQFLRHETDDYTRAGMEAEGTLSVISVPIFVNRALAGYIGFDDCSSERVWTPAELESLRIGAELVGSAWQRARSEEVLRSREPILTAPAGSAERLLHARAVTDAIGPLLADLGLAAGASRAYVFRTSETDGGEVVASHAYEWVREGMTPTLTHEGWQRVPLASQHASTLRARCHADPTSSAPIRSASSSAGVQTRSQEQSSKPM
jgi:GAF domain-containing protein